MTVWEEEKEGENTSHRSKDVRIAIAYGAGDAVSRVFFTTLEELETRYFRQNDSIQ